MSKLKLKKQLKTFIWQQSTSIEISLKVSRDNRLTVGLKRTPQHFLQVRRRNRDGDNKNAYYNIGIAFFI